MYGVNMDAMNAGKMSAMNGGNMDATNGRNMDTVNGVPTPNPALQQLERFAGKWKISGHNYIDAPNDAGAHITHGEQTYDWLPGKFFLVGKWDRTFEGGERHAGISLISFDEATQSFKSDGYDNLGYNRIYKMTGDGRTWKYEGEHERATLTFSEDGKRYTDEWEIRTEAGWEKLCHMEAHKVAGARMLTGLMGMF